VVELGIVERDRPVNRVLHHGLALARRLEAEGVRLRVRYIRLPARARIAEGLPTLLRGLPQGVERLRRAATAIPAAFCQHPLAVRPIDLRPLRLPIAMMRRAPVPPEPQPAHGSADRVRVPLPLAR